HPLARALPAPRGATQRSVVARILLTHSPEALALYYGERALEGLRSLGEVRLHEGREPLQGEQLIRAAEDCEIIVSYRQSPGRAGYRRRRWEGNCAAARSASSATAPSAGRYPGSGKLSACECWSTILTSKTSSRLLSMNSCGNRITWFHWRARPARRKIC